jgi:hypothetical protein
MVTGPARPLACPETFRRVRNVEHNDAVTDMQSRDLCPQCRNATAVHSMSELAAMARNQPARPNLGQLTGQQPGYAAPPQAPSQNPDYTQAQPGNSAQPQAGYAAEPQPSWGAEPQPGWAAEPQAGHGSGQQPISQAGRAGFDPSMIRRAFNESISDDIEGAVAGIALGAAAKFLTRSLGRRAQQAYNNKVVPALAQQQEAALREQDAIAERHPDLRACLTDQVFFLPSGGRVVPMPRAGMLTLQQSDAVVTQLRQY